MNHVTFLRFLLKGNRDIWDMPVSEQETFLKSLPRPSDDISRSFLQYLCQNFFVSRWKVWIFNFISFFLYFPFLILQLLQGLRFHYVRHYDALCDLKNMQEVIPTDLINRYDVHFNERTLKGGLRWKDLNFLLPIFFRYTPSFYFSLKTMLKVSQYSQLITMYSPKAVIAHAEYSFSSSLLTAYCHSRDTKHINVMHGEKLYNIRDAFFHFDECWIWDNFYKNLFIELKAESSQFYIFNSKSLHIDVVKYYNSKAWADYKYYLAIFTEKEIESIVKSMQFAKKKGKTIKYRLHPRYCSIDLILKYVSIDEIENPQQISILESVASCGTAVGSYSTVLAQAFFSGKNIVLDDITYHKQYQKLIELKYWLAMENRIQLSHLIEMES